MPKSKVRRKTAYTPPPNSRTPLKVAGPTHPVYVAVMLGLYYLAGLSPTFSLIVGAAVGMVCFLALARGFRNRAGRMVKVR